MTEQPTLANPKKEEATMIVEPKVTLLAHTVIDDDVIAELMDIQP